MRYDDNDSESSNVEDRRGQGGGAFGFLAVVVVFGFPLAVAGFP